MLRGTVSVLAAIAATGAWAAEPQNAAHAIAQKFAAPTETAAPTVKPADKPQAQPAAKAPSKPAAVTAIPDATPAKTTTADVAKPERPPLDYEMEMLRQARSEQLTKAPAQPPSAPPKSAPAPTPPARIEAKAPAAPAASVPEPSTPETSAPKPNAPDLSAPVQQAAPATSPAVPAVTPAPTAALAASSPSAAPAVPSAPAAPLTAAPVPAASPTPPVAQPAAPFTAAPAVAQAAAPAKDAKPAEPAAAPAAVAPEKPGTPATLLLALETSSGSGKARTSQSFDPVLCLNDTCYVSAGLKTDAVKLAKSDALKLKTSEEASQDSCKGMIACVYRNVSVPADAKLQVLELGSATHDSAHAADVKPDKTCKVADGNLTCDEPIATPDFKVWVVLEDTARAAGVEGLEEAVAEGLPHLDSTRGGDK